METRANYVLIGIFTLAVVFGAFAFVWWIERVGDMGGRSNYEIIFDASVSGLRPGAPVNFNGIRVGEVAALKLDRNDPRKVSVTVSIATGVPIRSDTRASLEYQGLTGIASVAMSGGRADAPPLVAQTGALPRILAEGGQMADLMSGAKQIMGRVRLDRRPHRPAARRQRRAARPGDQGHLNVHERSFGAFGGRGRADLQRRAARGQAQQDG